MSKPKCKSAITKCQKCNYQISKVQIQSANVANTKKREVIDFYSTLNACRMRINIKEGECKDEIRFGRDLDLG